jgi:holo-[acyl-carrier protein] synthase
LVRASNKKYMIEKLGIGIDIVNIQQFERISYSKKPRFYKKFFLPSEIKYCLKYKNPYPHFAGKFAVKEAVLKSIKEKIPLIDIETSYSRSKPIVQLRGKMNSKYKLLASISHENKFAISIVISEKID